MEVSLFCFPEMTQHLRLLLTAGLNSHRKNLQLFSSQKVQTKPLIINTDPSTLMRRMSITADIIR